MQLDNVMSPADTNGLMEACTRLFGVTLAITVPAKQANDDGVLLAASERMMSRLGDARSVAESGRPITLGEARALVIAVAKVVAETLTQEEQA